MRALIQRVTQGAVQVEGERLGAIGRGLVILVGVRAGDGDAEARWLANKIANLRIFEDDQGRFDLSLLDVAGSALVISQFTLYGDTRRGRRPSFSDAAAPELAAPLIERFIGYLTQAGVRDVQSGRFQAHMLVEIHNDGPVTLLLDTDVSRNGAPTG